MIQILKDRSFGSEFGRALGTGLGAGAAQGLEKGWEAKKLKQQQAQENTYLSKLGIDASTLTDPGMRQKVLEFALKGQQQDKKQGFLQQILGNLGLNDENQAQMNPQNQGIQSSQLQPESAQGVKPQNTGVDPKKLTDAQIAQATLIDPNLGRSLQHSKDVGLREEREQRNFEYQKQKDTSEYKRNEQITKAQAEQDIKYGSDLQNRMRKTVLKDESLNRIEKVVKKGVSGKPIDQILETVGLISKTSEGRRELAAEVKNQFTDFKEVAGSQLSGMEFQVLSGAYPNANFSKEANLAIIKNLKIVNDTLKKEYEVAEQLKKENGGKLPEDFQAKVNAKLFDYIGSKKEELHKNTIKILNSQYKIRPGYVLMFEEGDEEKPMEIPDGEVDKFLEMGDTLP